MKAKKMKKGQNKTARLGRKKAAIRTVEILGVEIQIIEKRGEYLFVGDFPKHIEKDIDAALAAMLNTKRVKDEHTLEREADLGLVAEIIHGA